MLKIISVQAIRSEACGDWHDKPVRYSVTGPNNELQKFSTKKDALKYASLRRRAASQQEASYKFAFS
jgi:hypothetical protein